jgi:hypothetical protein
MRCNSLMIKKSLASVTKDMRNINKSIMLSNMPSSNRCFSIDTETTIQIMHKHGPKGVSHLFGDLVVDRGQGNIFPIVVVPLVVACFFPVLSLVRSSHCSHLLQKQHKHAHRFLLVQ